MHPELRNNAVFLRYWSQWQQDPSSIVFASIADFMFRCRMFDEAIDICKKGLTVHPNFVMGRIVLARAYLEKNEKVLAEAELRRVLRIQPEQRQAKELLHKLQTEAIVEAVVDPKPVFSKLKTPVIKPQPPSQTEPKIKIESGPNHWETITMAKIYAAQGYRAKAKQVCQNILARDPANKAAREELNQLT